MVGGATSLRASQAVRSLRRTRISFRLTSMRGRPPASRVSSSTRLRETWRCSATCSSVMGSWAACVDPSATSRAPAAAVSAASRVTKAGSASTGSASIASTGGSAARSARSITGPPDAMEPGGTPRRPRRLPPVATLWRGRTCNGRSSRRGTRPARRPRAGRRLSPAAAWRRPLRHGCEPALPHGSVRGARRTQRPGTVPSSSADGAAVSPSARDRKRSAPRPRTRE